MKITKQSRRKDVVKRINPGQSVVVAASLKDDGDLAFAVAWLMSHWTYKRSKAHGVTPETCEAARAEVKKALKVYARDVEGTKKGMGIVSTLSQGEIINPYNLVNAS